MDFLPYLETMFAANRRSRYGSNYVQELEVKLSIKHGSKVADILTHRCHRVQKASLHLLQNFLTGVIASKIYDLYGVCPVPVLMAGQ